MDKIDKLLFIGMILVLLWMIIELKQRVESLAANHLALSRSYHGGLRIDDVVE